MTRAELIRLKDLTDSLQKNLISKDEFMEYQNLNELFLNELNLDQAAKRNNRFFKEN